MRKKLQNKIFLVTAVLFIFFSLFSYTYASEITDGLKDTLEAAIKVITNEELKKEKNKAKRRKLLRKIISNKFSYTEMSRRSLSKYWKERTPEEKLEFVELFGKLHDSSYANKLESYNNEKIIFKGEKVKGNIALVKTIIMEGDEEIPVNYKLVKLGDDWMVYDFIIEGMSLIKNYRAQFIKIIRKSSYQELIKKLKKKVKELE